MKTQETTATAAPKQSVKKPKASRANAKKATKAAKSPKQASNSVARPGSKKDITEFSSDQNARLIAERRPSFPKAIVRKPPACAGGFCLYGWVQLSG